MPSGRGLLLIAVLALVHAGLSGPGQVPPERAGTLLDVRLPRLSGDRFRLLPGVGPVLAERLERARVAAGGVLTEADAAHVPGVGPALLARWRAVVAGVADLEAVR